MFLINSFFRGFHECPEGKEKAFYTGAWHTGEWVSGQIEIDSKDVSPFYVDYDPDNTNYFIISQNGKKKVAYKTLGQDTNVCDIRGRHIHEDDIVAFPGDTIKYVVCFTGIDFCLHKCEAIHSARITTLCENVEIVGTTYDNEAVYEEWRRNLKL